ncbi:MAG: hypothetical protein OXE52_20215, partial [Chloroflexi bacterium]|nr:hypothetical protein [Chloroflexota bacterium]
GFNELIDAIRGRRKLDLNSEQIYVHRRFTSSGAIDPHLLINIFGRNEDLDTIRSLLDRGRPTFITGIGGIGKSRLAYEIALSVADVNGVIWHVCSDVSSPNDILELLRDHFGLPQKTPTENVIDLLRSQPQLIVIDNAESVQKRDLRSAYVNLANLLSQAGAQILLTSREKWGQLARASEYTPQDLALEPAFEVCRAMCELEDVTLANEQMRELATKAYLHPGFIDFAVSLTKNRGFDRAVKQLDTLQGRKVEEALHEMILQSVEQMKTSDSDFGSMAVETLRRLNVCRGGFTFQAAEALTMDLNSSILPQNDDDLDEALGLLQQWKFVRFDHERQRYNIGSLVTAAIGEDDEVYDSHYKYYKSLAVEHTRIDDFRGLDPEFENLTVAFERKLEQGYIRDAFFLCQNCTRLFFNRVRFDEWQDWLARVRPRIEVEGDDELRAHLMEALGDSHMHTLLGNRTENLKNSILYYEKALEYFMAIEYLPKETVLLHDLELAFPMIFESEQSVQHLHYAVSYYQKVLQLLAPAESAPTWSNLGLCHYRIGLLTRDVSALQAAIEYFNQSLQLSSDRGSVLRMANTLIGLAETYIALANHENFEDNINNAQLKYQDALQFATPDTDPMAYSLVRFNRGKLNRLLAIQKNSSEYMSQAIEDFEDALIYCSSQHAPGQRAMILHALGVVKYEMGSAEEAIQLWTEAKDCFTTVSNQESAKMVQDLITQAENLV